VSGAAVAASLPEMRGRLRLTAMRDRLDGLLDEAARRDLTLPDALALLCAAEVAHREERRIQMGLGIAKFPYVRTLEGFDFAAQPSIDKKQIRAPYWDGRTLQVNEVRQVWNTIMTIAVKNGLRGQILDESAKLFIAHGFNGTTINDMIVESPKK